MKFIKKIQPNLTTYFKFLNVYKVEINVNASLCGSQPKLWLQKGWLKSFAFSGPTVFKTSNGSKNTSIQLFIDCSISNICFLYDTEFQSWTCSLAYLSDIVNNKLNPNLSYLLFLESKIVFVRMFCPMENNIEILVFKSISKVYELWFVYFYLQKSR